MSVVCLSWETAHLHGETWISHHRLRHRLFVERQGWAVPHYKGMEYDEFGIRHGINRYLAAMPVRLLTRVVVRAGCKITVLGPERTLGNLPAAASYLTIGPEVLAEVRRRASIAGPVLRTDMSVAA